MQRGIEVIRMAYHRISNAIPGSQGSFSGTRFSRYTLRAFAALLLVAVPTSVASYAVRTDNGSTSQLEPMTRGSSNKSDTDVRISQPITSPSTTTQPNGSSNSSSSFSSSSQSSSNQQTNNKRAAVTVEINGQQVAVPQNGEVHRTFNDGMTNSNVDVSVQSSGNASSTSSSNTSIEINSTSTSEGDAP